MIRRPSAQRLSLGEARRRRALYARVWMAVAGGPAGGWLLIYDRERCFVGRLRGAKPG